MLVPEDNDFTDAPEAPDILDGELLPPSDVAETSMLIGSGGEDVMLSLADDDVGVIDFQSDEDLPYLAA